MKEVKLNRGYVALVDDEDYDFIVTSNWCVWEHHGNKYAKSRRMCEDGKKRVISMHSLLVKLSDGQQVDHIDGNGLNNQKKNLRACYQRDNIRNKKQYGKSGYKGVHINTLNRKTPEICAYIVVNKTNIYLGSFKKIDDAARAYDKAAVYYFGEFANLNFPEEWGREKRAS